MPTARDIIVLGMKEAGILGVGQTLLSEDVNDGFILLKRMVAQWQRKRWLVPSLKDIAMLGNGNVSNPIGPGQYWNVARPDKIQGGYVIQQNTGSTPVSLPLYPIFAYEDYIRISVKNLNSLPDHFFYDNAYPVGNVFIWPIPTSTYQIHLLLKAQLGFSTTIASGLISAVGAAYVNGVYNNVPLAPLNPGSLYGQSSGTGATANITVAGGAVTGVVIQNGGEDFNVGDILTASNTYLGNAGAGFNYTVTGTTDNLNSDIDMPPEYEEALHYNLALRICSMYQIQAQDETKFLARSALNTLRMANTQVPELRMPPTLRRGKSFNIFNADGFIFLLTASSVVNYFLFHLNYIMS